MAVFTFNVVGEREAGLRFEEFPKKAYTNLDERITALTSELYARVVSAAPKRTGKLRDSITMKIEKSPDRITGRVSVDADFAKAGALEFGSHRMIEVRAHSEALGRATSAALAGPNARMVEAYNRTTNIIAERFLRGPLGAMQGDINSQLRAAVDAAVAETE
jgi:hypothetical protein